MKMFGLQKTFLAVIAAAGLLISGIAVGAQNSAPAVQPPLSYGVPQILQLAQANVGEDAIIAYIHSTGNSYGLNADQIIYLKQQGISENIIIAMLNQPRPAATPAPEASTAPAPPAYAQPAPAYVQSAPSPTVYVVPNSQPYYYTSTYYSQPYFYASYYPYYYYPYCGRYYYPNCGRYYYGRPCVRPVSTASFAFGAGGGFHGVAFAGGFHGGTTFHSNVGHMGGQIAFHSGGMVHR